MARNQRGRAAVVSPHADSCQLETIEKAQERNVEAVRGSYSARVPNSSLAGVHREFVHHIVEEEADGREEKQDDVSEDRQQEEEGRIKHTTWAHEDDA